MSHRIIISSNNVATDQSSGGPDYHITYTPPHDQPDEVTLQKVEKLLKVAHKIEAICDGDSD
jgi:hypothetical protein